jgi:hypothetical protein
MSALQYDSENWRQIRNSLLQKWVQDNNAIVFLLIIGNTAELWDDLIDQDKDLSPNEINTVFVDLLIRLPLNPFFEAYKAQLTPLMITGINTWQDSNALATGEENDKAIAYVLRDWYVEIVMFVIYLLRGYETMRDLSLEVRKFFGQHESLQAYMEKLT